MTNTDDFIWRMVKGCVQLGLVPDINNTVNMVPVDHVARCVSLATLSPLLPDSTSSPSPPLPVLHVQATPLPTFNAFLSTLSEYGFKTEQCEYLVWRRKLEQHVMEVQDNALFPLLHFVLDDLPTSTKAPALDDSNMVAVLHKGVEGEGEREKMVTTVGEELMGLYLAWLVLSGFLPGPEEGGKKALPRLEGGVAKAVGRSGAA